MTDKTTSFLDVIKQNPSSNSTLSSLISPFSIVRDNCMADSATATAIVGATVIDGNGGAPLFDSKGHLIGIVVGELSPHRLDPSWIGVPAAALAIPINEARRVAQHLIAYGEMVYGWLKEHEPLKAEHIMNRIRDLRGGQEYQPGKPGGETPGAGPKIVHAVRPLGIKREC